MSRIGYARISTKEQNLDIQMTELKASGCEKIFVEKCSGLRERPKLQEALAYLRKDDTLIVYKFDRIGRSLRDLITTINNLQQRGIGILSNKDHVDASSASGRLMMHIFASLAEFERDLIVDRCQSGREEAKEGGIKFGRYKKEKEAKTKACAALYKDNIPLNKIMSQLGIKSKATVYRYLRLENIPIFRQKI